MSPIREYNRSLEFEACSSVPSQVTASKCSAPRYRPDARISELNHTAGGSFQPLNPCGKNKSSHWLARLSQSCMRSTTRAPRYLRTQRTRAIALWNSSNVTRSVPQTTSTSFARLISCGTYMRLQYVLCNRSLMRAKPPFCNEELAAALATSNASPSLWYCVMV